MKNYESLIIIKPTLSDEDTQSLIETVQGWITGAEGEIIASNPWGVRELAYPINKFTQGFYYLLQFRGNNKTINEFQTRFRVTESFIRELTVTMDSVYSKKTAVEEAVVAE